jgi:hypothetical protein
VKVACFDGVLLLSLFLRKENRSPISGVAVTVVVVRGMKSECGKSSRVLQLIQWATRVYRNFPDWPPGARTANGTALCHWVQLYRCFMGQSSEFCLHNPLCCFSTSVYCYCKHIFRYHRLSPENFGYTLIFRVVSCVNHLTPIKSNCSVSCGILFHAYRF